eukprot:TRINITY_DN6600_c0_g1_i2.p1 TRINITY_DN6600_c0_g1~~TRINITY_DN6600_c0_g1_i2.p1  ORF type:complete len:601 (+),score=153.88 TRINITY_DN6600_c0_g1_i2:146-1804(+)
MADLEYLQNLCDKFLAITVPDEIRKEFANLTLQFFEGRNSTFDFLRDLVTEQVHRTNNHSVILREESPATRFLALYFRTDPGIRYLKTFLCPMFDAVYRHPESLQLNPEKSDATKSQAALKFLLGLTNDILQKIFSTQYLCPLGYRRILLHLKTQMLEKFSDSQTDVIGAYFFLSFICPVIIQPTSVQLMPTKPTPNAQMGLIAISKILQHLANGSHFDAAQFHYAPETNQFIDKMAPNMKQFLTDLLDEDTIEKHRAIIEANVDLYRSQGRQRIREIQKLQQFVIENSAKIHPNPRHSKASQSEFQDERIQAWRQELAVVVIEIDSPDLNWKIVDRKVAEISMATTKPDKSLYGKAKVTVPCSLRKLNEYLRTWKAVKLDPFLIAGELIEEIDEGTDVMQFVYRGGFLQSRRDVVVFRHGIQLENECQHAWVAITHPKAPKSKGMVRIDMDYYFHVESVKPHESILTVVVRSTLETRKKFMRKALLKEVLRSICDKILRSASQIEMGTQITSDEDDTISMSNSSTTRLSRASSVSMQSQDVDDMTDDDFLA